MLNNKTMYYSTIGYVKHTSLALLFFLLLGGINTAIASPSVNINKNPLTEIKLNDVKTGQLLFNGTSSATNNLSNKFYQAPQLNTQVAINIQGVVANTNVEQTFTNTTDEWQHAKYVFPLPHNAAVNQLTITVGDRIIKGKIKEKQQALKIYNKAKQQGKKAALVQQLRANLFTTDVANIPPHETIEVSLTYFQPVKVEDEQFSIHYPMTITPRYTPAGEVFNPLPNMVFQQQKSHKNNTSIENAKIDLTVTLDAGAALANIQSINHPLLITQTAVKQTKAKQSAIQQSPINKENIKQDSTQANATVFNMALKEQPLDKDFELVWRYKKLPLPQVINFKEQYQQQEYGLLMLLPGLAQNDILPARDLIFVLDKSGSMAGNSMKQAQLAFKHALTSLTEYDTFQLISFDNAAQRFFEHSVPATQFNKNNAWQHVLSLTADGGTNIQSALTLAFNNKTTPHLLANEPKKEVLEQIVFLTDGAVGNEAEIFKDIHKNIKNKRLFTVGLGAAPNRYFMNKAAEVGRGSYQIINNSKTLANEMNALFMKLRQPVLTNIKFNLNQTNNSDNNALLVTVPNPIPDVYASEPIFLSYKIQSTIDNVFTNALLTASYQNKPWQMVINLNDVENKGIKSNNFNQEIPAIATLWARRNITDLYDSLMLSGDQQAKQKIIALGLQFNLVTPFTSLVAVEEKISRPNHTKAQNKQLKNNLPTGQKLPSTSLNILWQLNLALLLFSMAIFIVLVTNLKRTYA